MKWLPSKSALLLSCLAASSAIFLLQQVGCKKSPTEPEVSDPRNYKWSADTLSIPSVQILMNSIWGTSDNLYAVGHSAGSAGTMWHFDGNKWTNVKLGSFEGGTIPAPFDLFAIHGSSADNIVAVGNRSPFWPGISFMIHYDGKQWKEQQAPSGSSNLLSVWVNARNDAWTCGVNGTLLHYDGVQWNKDSVVVSTPSGSKFSLTSIVRIPSGELFMMGSAYEGGTPDKPLRWSYYFFRREGEQWRLLDTYAQNDGEQGGKWGGSRLVVLPSGTMYSVGSSGVTQWNGTQWIKRFEHTNSTSNIFGTSDNNFFVTGPFGLLVHYNGADWFEYRDLARQNVHHINGWADEEQAFVLGWVDGEKTVVLRGR